MVPRCGLGLFRASERRSAGHCSAYAPSRRNRLPNRHCSATDARNIVPLNGCTRTAHKDSHRSRPSTGPVDARFAPRTVHTTHAAGDTTRFVTDRRRHFGRPLRAACRRSSRLDRRQQPVGSAWSAVQSADVGLTRSANQRRDIASDCFAAWARSKGGRATSAVLWNRSLDGRISRQLDDRKWPKPGLPGHRRNLIFPTLWRRDERQFTGASGRRSRWKHASSCRRPWRAAHSSSSERSIQAVCSCTVSLCVSRSAVGSSPALSASGKMPRAVRATAS